MDSAVVGNNETANFFGIEMDSSSNNNVSGNNVTGNLGSGIDLIGDSNNTVSGNNATANWYGISVESSNDTMIGGNSVTANNVGIDISTVDPPTPTFSINDTVIGNNVTANGDGIDLDSENDTVINNDVAANGRGIGLSFVIPADTNNTVSGNNVTRNGDGIFVIIARNNTLTGNTATANTQYGLSLEDASNNTVSWNTATANGDDGIYLSSNNNDVYGNDATANGGDGIDLYGANNNTVSGNSAIANANYGVLINYSWYNTMYHNNFVGNPVQAAVVNSTGVSGGNVWDNGYPSGGNYWSDYQSRYPNASEIDDSGVWNTPYVIDSNNTDDYPLMEPYFGLHEVGITALNLSKTVVGRGYGLNVTFTATDFGDYSETFNVTVYANATIVASQNVTLSGGTSTTIALSYNTSGLTYGNYAISAYAWPVPGQTNTANDNCTGGNVVVTIPGDVNGNHIVDKDDLALLLGGFGSTTGTARYNANCDIENNGRVDMGDVMIALYNFGQHYP